MDSWIAHPEAAIYCDISHRHAVITLSSRCHSVSSCCTSNQNSFTESASKCPFSLHTTWFWNNNTFAGDYGSVLGVMVRLMSLPQLISVLPDTLTCNNVHPCQKFLRVCSCSNCTLYPPPLESCLEAIKFIPSYLLPSGLGMAFSHLLFFLTVWIKRPGWIFFRSVDLFSRHKRLCMFTVFLCPVRRFSVKISHRRMFHYFNWIIIYCNKICWLKVQMTQLRKHSC